MEQNGFMKEKDMVKILELIDGACQNFRLTENTAKSYYLYLKGFKNKDVWSVVYNWLERKATAPTIPDILGELKKYYPEYFSSKG